MTIKAVAPGKAVLIGEYSVLAGGPAVVLATSSFASISLESTSSESWVFETLGFQSEPELVNPDKLPASSGSSLISAILKNLVSQGFGIFQKKVYRPLELLPTVQASSSSGQKIRARIFRRSMHCELPTTVSGTQSRAKFKRGNRHP